MISAVFIVVKFSVNGLNQYLTTGSTETVVLDGTARQFITGAILSNFETITSAGEFEGNDVTLKIAETDRAGFWQRQTELQNILHTDAVFMRKKTDGTLSENSAIFKGWVSDCGTDQGVFYLKIQDRVHDLLKPFSDAIMESEYPNSGINAGKYIATGVGIIDTTKIPVSTKYAGGVAIAYLVDVVGNDKTYIAFDTVETDGSETVTKVLKDLDVDVPNFTVTKTTFSSNGQNMVRVFINSSGSSLPNELKIWPTFGYKGLTPLTALKKLLKNIGSTLVVDETSTVNQEFSTRLQQKKLQIGSDLETAFFMQGEQSAAEMLKMFQESFDCLVRTNALGKLEFISIPYGNITSSYKIFPSDIIKFNYSNVIDSEIYNDIEVFWGYRSIDGESIFYESDLFPDRAWSIATYQTHHIHLYYRWAYTENHACTMQKFTFARKFIPYIETSMSIVEKNIPSTILPGDIVDLTDRSDISNGTQKRLYVILRMKRNLSTGICDLILWDVTKHALLDYACQVQIQTENGGVTHFCDFSLGPNGSLPITNINIKQEVDATAINGVSWKYKAANACLYIPQAYFGGTANISTVNQLSIAMMFKPLSVSSAQYLWCHAREDTQRDLIALRQLPTGVLSVIKQTNTNTDWTLTSTNTVSAGSWYHVVVYFEKSGINTICTIYVNGVKWATGTNATGTVTNSAFTIGAGIYFGYGGTPVQYNTGSFQEFAIHHGNPWSAGGANCTQQTLQNTFFGVNGKLMYDRFYPPD